MSYQTGIRLFCVAQNPANGFPARLLDIEVHDPVPPLVEVNTDKCPAQWIDDRRIIFSLLHPIRHQATLLKMTAPEAGDEIQITIETADTHLEAIGRLTLESPETGLYALLWRGIECYPHEKQQAEGLRAVYASVESDTPTSFRFRGVEYIADKDNLEDSAY